MSAGLASTCLSWSLWNTKYRSCSAATWAVDFNCSMETASHKGLKFGYVHKVTTLVLDSLLLCVLMLLMLLPAGFWGASFSIATTCWRGLLSDLES